MWTRWTRRLGLCLGAAVALGGCPRGGAAAPSEAGRLAGRMAPGRFSPPGGGAPLAYRLYAPAPAPGPLPLIVWLHGTDGRGQDGLRHLGPEVALLLSERVQAAGPAFVLAPQCPEGRRWANPEATFPLRPYRLAEVPETAEARAVAALVAELVATRPIDPRRVYLVGFSMGGTGTWDLLMRHPGLFAAGVPIAGVADVERADLLARVPVWAFHGAQDETSPVENGRRMARALRDAGAPARLTELEGLGHGAVGRALEEPGLFAWLLGQRR